MNHEVSWLKMTELDLISSLELAARIEEFGEGSAKPRGYPGYPTFALPRSKKRWFTGLDRTLVSRRCTSEPGRAFPDCRRLSRLLWLSHGVSGNDYRGPTPSAGGLQAIELYLVNWQSTWLPAGVYHYGRRNHVLAQISQSAIEEEWRQCVPSLRSITGGAVLWLIAGDSRRVEAKYGERSDRFLLLEAGHLMQNLCLVSASLNLTTVPLGGVLEQEVSVRLTLPPTDHVLYAGICG